MKSWLEQKQEESYLRTLDAILLKRLREDSGSQVNAINEPKTKPKSNLCRFSQEINEELERLESMIEEELSTCHHAENQSTPAAGRVVL